MSVASSPAILTIIGPPVILLQPASLTVNDGANIQFAVTARRQPVASVSVVVERNQLGGR